MLHTIVSGERKASLLSRYSTRMGAMVDRRLSQVALEAARKEADSAARHAVASNRAKSEFLANMSHELHTPLSSILGFAEMMEREVIGPMPAAYREYAKNILESGRQLHALVTDVLNMSQIETGHYTLVEEDIDISATMAAVFRLVQGRAAQTGLYLQARLPKDLPPLRGDPRAFKQILMNLLGNAIKFTNPGGRIYVLPALTPEGDLTLRVVDTGIGIKESEIGRILQPFEQIGETTTRKQPGAGLGLALVKALIGLHGGTMHVQSKVAVGTIVTVTFPRWRLHRADTTAATAGATPPMPARFAFTGDAGSPDTGPNPPPAAGTP